MRKIFMLCAILIVLQIIDVSTATTRPVNSRVKKTTSGNNQLVKSENDVPRTAAKTQKRNAEKPAVGDEDAAPLARDGVGNVGDEPNQQLPSGPGAANVGGDRAADTAEYEQQCGELGQLMGNFVREQLAKNRARVIEFENEQMSGLSKSLVNVVSNVMRSCAAGLADGEGALRMLSDVMQDAALTGDGGGRKAASPETTKTLSGVARRGRRGQLRSSVGVRSEEAEDGRDREDEFVPPPPPAPKTRRTVSKTPPT